MTQNNTKCKCSKPNNCSIGDRKGLCYNCGGEIKRVSKMSLKLKGIYGLENLNCGCTIKHYTGGKKVLEASQKCTAFIKHRTVVWNQCGICGYRTSKKLLKEHKDNEHSI